ncbi:NAD(P)-binding domain-containing protein [Enemella evansiae]|uniref:NAD(P)-binding domain-containing protein n=1 Tax=Enemella evansiae TaxID=2016499 RepID=UPI00105BFA6D|nr:NAD(P)-binding domain-containing protein [Enemella evansiae]TDO86233.1 pyrroline-5-carboxylate reductase [Enemella evansiae]
MQIGIIGVGAIAEAIVDGLATTEQPPGISLSPRGARTAGALAARYGTVRVELSNQAVVDRCELVLLTVPPGAITAVLEGLYVPADRVLVSAAAGVSLANLKRLLPNQPQVMRVIPLPAVRAHRGVTVIFPDHRTSKEVFASLGEVLVPVDEDRFEALSAATATLSSQLGLLAAIADWLSGRGLEPAVAEGFVRGMALGLGESLADPGRSLAVLVGDHETPGGINELVRHAWLGPVDRARLAAALDQVVARSRGVPHNSLG